MDTLWCLLLIVEVLGSVTYVVETEQGQRWKWHADQLKDWLPIVPATTSGSASEDISDHSIFDSEDVPEEPAIEPSDLVEPEPTDPHIEPEPPPEDFSRHNTESAEPQYPRRIRRPPNRYE